jgi:hypothetical protein
MISQLLFWSARILSILAILFVMMFSLDCFEGTSLTKDQLVCFVMHNIPAFIIIAVLVIAWNRELAGGLLFLVAALAGSIVFKGFSGNPAVFIVMAPFVLTGLLFILHHVLYGPAKQDTTV